MKTFIQRKGFKAVNLLHAFNDGGCVSKHNGLLPSLPPVQMNANSLEKHFLHRLELMESH